MSCLGFLLSPFFFSFLHLSIYIFYQNITLVVHDYLLFSVLFFKKTDVISTHLLFLSFLRKNRLIEIHTYFLFLSLSLFTAEYENISCIPLNQVLIIDVAFYICAQRKKILRRKRESDRHDFLLI
jgi:hypothetical protein